MRVTRRPAWEKQKLSWPLGGLFKVSGVPALSRNLDGWHRCHNFRFPVRQKKIFWATRFFFLPFLSLSLYLFPRLFLLIQVESSRASLPLSLSFPLSPSLSISLGLLHSHTLFSLSSFSHSLPLSLSLSPSLSPSFRAKRFFFNFSSTFLLITWLWLLCLFAQPESQLNEQFDASLAILSTLGAAIVSYKILVV